MDEITVNRIDSVKVLDEIIWLDKNIITCNVKFVLKGSQVIKTKLVITINIRPAPSKSEITKVIQNVNNYLYPETNQAQLSFGNNISVMYESSLFSLEMN